MTGGQAEQDGDWLAFAQLAGQIGPMTWITTVLGALTALGLAGAAMAEPAARPFSRLDAQLAQVAAAQAAQAGRRAEARPLHMIRYPVEIQTSPASVRPTARDPFLPRTRWDFKAGGQLWTRTAMTAVGAFGDGLQTIVPKDIDRWCPAYVENSDALRRAFWVGMMSALSKHESTYNPRAVGGGDLWYGLLQIYPDTARRYGCRARTGEALKNPVDNLSCAARIMAVTVARDQAVAVRDTRWRGVAADWGPMTKPKKIAEMSNWTRAQTYCKPLNSVRPTARPNARISTD